MLSRCGASDKKVLTEDRPATSNSVGRQNSEEIPDRGNRIAPRECRGSCYGARQQRLLLT